MIDKKNLLLVIVVLVVVVIVGYVRPKRSGETSNLSTGAGPAASQAHTLVRYTPKGFKPATVTVKVGSTVAWVNESGRPMWVASDPHPSHTDLQGFDQLKIINLRIVPAASAHEGGAYEYTFMKIGKWKYHNHIYPSDRGEVIVEE